MQEVTFINIYIEEPSVKSSEVSLKWWFLWQFVFTDKKFFDILSWNVNHICLQAAGLWSSIVIFYLSAAFDVLCPGGYGFIPDKSGAISGNVTINHSYL